MLFKIRLILASDLTEVAMRKLSKNENEYGILKIVNAVQQNVFLPIVVSEHFISMYEFCSCPHIGTIDLGTEDFAARFHVPVLGYNRSINEHTCADPDTIKHVMQLETGKGVRQRYVRKKDTGQVEDIFQKEPDDVFDGITGLLGVSTWFPRDLTNYKLEKRRKNIRLYRGIG